IAVKIMSYFPDPTDSGVAFTHASNFNKTITRAIEDHRVDVRGDQSFGDKHRVFASYALGRRTWQNPNVYGDVADPAFRTYPSDPTSIKAGYIYSINSSWVAEVRYAYNHLYFGQVPGSLGFDITQLGFPK